VWKVRRADYWDKTGLVLGGHLLWLSVICEYDGKRHVAYMRQMVVCTVFPLFVENLEMMEFQSGEKLGRKQKSHQIRFVGENMYFLR